MRIFVINALATGLGLRTKKLAVAAEGISLCPESAACVGAAEHLVRTGFIKPSDQVVLFNCGAAQKYPHLLPPDLPCLPKGGAIDWAAIGRDH
jgi:threonine synthase